MSNKTVFSFLLLQKDNTLNGSFGRISSLKLFRETFRKKYIVERTNKAEIRLGEQSEKAESCRENL